MIKNNCIVDCGNHGIWVCGPWGNVTAATITNNTIAYNGGDGIEQSCSNGNESYIKNNIIYRNSNLYLNAFRQEKKSRIFKSSGFFSK